MFPKQVVCVRRSDLMFSVEKIFVRFKYVAIIPFQHVFSQNKDSALSACSTPLKQAQYLYIYINTLQQKCTAGFFQLLPVQLGKSCGEGQHSNPSLKNQQQQQQQQQQQCKISVQYDPP